MTPIFKRPAYTIPAVTGWLAVAAVPGLYHFWPDLPDTSARDQTALFVLAIFVVLAVYEIVFEKIYNSVGTGLLYRSENFRDQSYINDLLIKYVGLLTSVFVLGLFYFTADIYRDDWYDPFFSLVKDYWAHISFVILVNVTVVHFIMRHPRDGLWQLGNIVTTLGRMPVSARKLNVHLLGLAVKGYFLPMMFCYLVYDWEYLASRSLYDSEDFSQVYEYLYRFLFFFDVAIVVMGYALGVRILNSHIRWTETTLLGWLVCVACYTPFWQILSREYFDYVEDGSFAWGAWLWDYPVLYGIWGSAILFLISIYTLASARMGLRFSNLTYRGLACDFPYSISKHPAYLSKNATWWLISIPFIATDFLTGLANCIALIGVNVLYYMRAKCEERCLGQAPSYRAYQRHVDRYGLLAVMRQKTDRSVRNILASNG